MSISVTGVDYVEWMETSLLQTMPWHNGYFPFTFDANYSSDILLQIFAWEIIV